MVLLLHVAEGYLMLYESIGAIACGENYDVIVLLLGQNAKF